MYYKPHWELGLMSLADISRFTGHHFRTVKKWTQEKGHPKATVVGKRSYWRRKEIEKYYK
jgi:hypothetical protein